MPTNAAGFVRVRVAGMDTQDLAFKVTRGHDGELAVHLKRLDPEDRRWLVVPVYTGPAASLCSIQEALAARLAAEVVRLEPAFTANTTDTIIDLIAR